jgi:hypothetical protein
LGFVVWLGFVFLGHVVVGREAFVEQTRGVNGTRARHTHQDRTGR